MQSMRGLKKEDKDDSESFLQKVNSTTRGEGITFADNGLPLLYQKPNRFTPITNKPNINFS